MVTEMEEQTDLTKEQKGNIVNQPGQEEKTIEISKKKLPCDHGTIKQFVDNTYDRKGVTKVCKKN